MRSRIHRRASRPGERGFTLVEVMVAGAVLVITLLGLGLLTIVSARHARQGTMEAGAALLASALIADWQARGPQAIQAAIDAAGGGDEQVICCNDDDPRLVGYAGDVLGAQKQMQSARRITSAQVTATRQPAATANLANSYQLRVQVEWTDASRAATVDNTGVGVFQNNRIEQVAYVCTAP